MFLYQRLSKHHALRQAPRVHPIRSPWWSWVQHCFCVSQMGKLKPEKASHFTQLPKKSDLTAIKSLYCSLRGPKTDSQHPYGVVHNHLQHRLLTLGLRQACDAHTCRQTVIKINTEKSSAALVHSWIYQIFFQSFVSQFPSCFWSQFPLLLF